MANLPSDLRYATTHEWIRLDGDTAVVGITDFAQSELGDVVFVELPSPGRILKAGDPFGSVESVKTVSEVYAPVDGEVLEANSTLTARSELVNEDPYGKGYLIKIRVSDPAQLDALLDAAGYEASIA